MDGNARSVQVVESYIKYEPPYSVGPVVRDLLKCLPDKYLAGLDCVVLTNASGQPRRERRQKTRSRQHKTALIRALGFYQPAPKGRKPHIELYVDNILKNCRPPEGVLGRAIRCFFIRWRFAKVLYHEVGHHVHETQRPEHREPENVAEQYTRRLMRRFVVRRLHILAFSLSAVLLSPRIWPRLFFYVRIGIMALLIRLSRRMRRRAHTVGAA